MRLQAVIHPVRQLSRSLSIQSSVNSKVNSNMNRQPMKESQHRGEIVPFFMFVLKDELHHSELTAVVRGQSG